MSIHERGATAGTNASETRAQLHNRSRQRLHRRREPSTDSPTRALGHVSSNGKLPLSARARLLAAAALRAEIAPSNTGSVPQCSDYRLAFGMVSSRTDEFAPRLLEDSTRLPSGRFHGLFNSLFKVLFNFPTRYLFAVGLADISSSAFGGVYHRLEATLASSPTLRSERQALNGLAEVRAPATGLSPFSGRPRSSGLRG